MALVLLGLIPSLLWKLLPYSLPSSNGPLSSPCIALLPPICSKPGCMGLSCMWICPLEGGMRMPWKSRRDGHEIEKIVTEWEEDGCTPAGNVYLEEWSREASKNGGGKEKLVTHLDRIHLPLHSNDGKWLWYSYQDPQAQQFNYKLNKYTTRYTCTCIRTVHEYIQANTHEYRHRKIECMYECMNVCQDLVPTGGLGGDRKSSIFVIAQKGKHLFTSQNTVNVVNAISKNSVVTVILYLSFSVSVTIRVLSLKHWTCDTLWAKLCHIEFIFCMYAGI